MNTRMDNHFDQSLGAITGVGVWIVTHIWSFPMLQIHNNPIASELLISSIRLIFGVATAVICYLAIHWIKKNITHEEIKTAKKPNKQQ